jgi:hypothetical protein
MVYRYRSSGRSTLTRTTPTSSGCGSPTISRRLDLTRRTARCLFGFSRPDMNQLAPANSPLCKITLNDPSALSPAPGGYHRVEFYNLYRYSTRWFDQYESWMIFEIKMVNPPTARWPASSAMTGFWNDQVWPASQRVKSQLPDQSAR